MFDGQDRAQRLDDLRRRVRDEPPAGGNAARIRLQLPNGSKVKCGFKVNFVVAAVYFFQVMCTPLIRL